jgi:hypothetical protein
MAHDNAKSFKSLPVILNLLCKEYGISLRQRLILTPVEHMASKARIGLSSGVNQLFSKASCNSSTDLVLDGAMAGLRKPPPVFFAGPRGMCVGLSWFGCKWTIVLPSSQILPGQPSGISDKSIGDHPNPVDNHSSIVSKQF